MLQIMRLKKKGVTYAAGILGGINEVNSEKAQGVVITLNGDKKSSPFKAGFFNNAKSNWKTKTQKAKLENSVGKPICLKVKETGNLNLGYDFYYPGTRISRDEKADIYFCRIGGIKRGARGQTVLSLPVIIKGKETEWVTVSFWNSDDGTLAVADNAYKYLKKGDAVMIVASKVRELENGAKAASGYSFQKI